MSELFSSIAGTFPSSGKGGKTIMHPWTTFSATAGHQTEPCRAVWLRCSNLDQMFKPSHEKGGMHRISFPGPLLVFGASRGAGFELARSARKHALPVYAMVRSPNEELERMGVRTVCGDALDREAPAAACRTFSDARAVVCTMGGGTVGASADYQGVIHVVDAAEAACIRRLVLVTSLGAGDSRPFASERLLAAIGPVLEEKTKAEEYLAHSGLEYTIIRPGRLLDGESTGNGKLLADPSVHGGIRRAELAELILRCLSQEETTGKIFSAVEAEG